MSRSLVKGRADENFLKPHTKLYLEVAPPCKYPVLLSFKVLTFDNRWYEYNTWLSFKELLVTYIFSYLFIYLFIKHCLYYYR